LQARNHHGSGLWYSEVTRSRHVAVATPEVQHAEAFDRAEHREERWVDEGAVPEVALIALKLVPIGSHLIPDCVQPCHLLSDAM
jgi:hypothetical protein